MTDTSLMTHALALFGVTPKKVSPVWLFRGRRVTKIDWRGCMADVRRVVAVGYIVRRESRWRHQNGKLVTSPQLAGWKKRKPPEWPGIIVRYPTGEQWEAAQDIRFIGGRFGRIEVWR